MSQKVLGSQTNGSSVWIITANNSIHSTSTSSNNWTSVNGTNINFNLTNERYVRIDVHCHGNCNEEGRRLDVGIFVDGAMVGTDGFHDDWTGNDGSNQGTPGMGLSICPFVIPIMSVGVVSLNPGPHNVDVRIRSYSGGQVGVSAVGVIVTIY